MIQDLVRFRRMLPDAFDVFRTKYLAGGATERRALEVLELRIPALKGHVDSMRQLLRDTAFLAQPIDDQGLPGAYHLGFHSARSFGAIPEPFSENHTVRPASFAAETLQTTRPTLVTL